MKGRKNISELEAEETSSKGSTGKHEFNRNGIPGPQRHVGLRTD